MAATAEYKCQCCKKPFTARTADRARGWARFCSKRCAATKQTDDEVRAAEKQRPWQRFDKCQDDDDKMDLLRNPRIIEPLYDEYGDRSGEMFYAGGFWDEN